MKVKIIQTGIKVYNLVVSDIIPRLKEVGRLLSERSRTLKVLLMVGCLVDWSVGRSVCLFWPFCSFVWLVGRGEGGGGHDCFSRVFCLKSRLDG